MSNEQSKRAQERGEQARREIAAQQRKNRRVGRGTGNPADWGSADGTKLASAIAAVTQHGHAIRFGYTRDGGAFAVGIVGDGEPFTEFIRPTEDINLYLDGLTEDYRHIVDNDS